jgi:hypothetical protein
MNEPVAEYSIDGSRMDRIAWIYVRAWPEETERGGACASLIPDNHVRAVGEASASPGWRDGPLLRGLRDKVADAFGASDPVLQDTHRPASVVLTASQRGRQRKAPTASRVRKSLTTKTSGYRARQSAI